MGDTDASRAREFTTTPAMEAIDILWLTAGLGCDGDTIAMTGATQPSIEDVVTGALPWIPKVRLYNPFLAIETQESRFVVKAFSTGLLFALGHSPSIAIRDFSGDGQFSPGAPLENARVLASIRTDSLACTDDMPEKDQLDIHRRMHDEVLETDRFPEIDYECSRVTGSGNGDRYWVALSGELTLHGVTRSLPISARVVVNGDSFAGYR